MSEAVAISDDALKLLVAEHGVRGTARLLGMDETTMNTFRKRVTRAGWMNEPEIAQIRAKSSPTVVAAPIVSRVSPVQAQAMELANLGGRTKMGFARAMAAVADTVATRDPEENLADAGNVKAAAQTAELIHGWRDQPKPSAMRLEVLLTKPETHVDAIEIDSQVVEGQWDNDVPQDT